MPWVAFFFLSLFYLLYIPINGVPQPGNEGTYLIVNKTLVEAVAVLVILVFDTGKIAGLDLLLRRRRMKHQPIEDPVLAAPVVSRVNKEAQS